MTPSLSSPDRASSCGSSVAGPGASDALPWFMALRVMRTRLQLIQQAMALV